MNQSIHANSTVLLHFILKLEDGSIAESTREQGKPVLFQLGNGSLSAQLEQHLIGLRSGDQRQFTLPAAAAFGECDPDLIHYFSRQNFSQTTVPEPGTIMLFSQMQGGELPGIIREVIGETVTVDFNHPLAGQSVDFTIDVLEVRAEQEATDENSVS